MKEPLEIKDLFTLSHLERPTCGREDCNELEHPEHWVGVHAGPALLALIHAAREALTWMDETMANEFSHSADPWPELDALELALRPFGDIAEQAITEGDPAECDHESGHFVTPEGTQFHCDTCGCNVYLGIEEANRRKQSASENWAIYRNDGRKITSGFTSKEEAEASIKALVDPRFPFSYSARKESAPSQASA